MKRNRGKSLVLGVLSIGMLGGSAWGYSYTWDGFAGASWSGLYSWIRSGCNPCSEYPDDTGDDATIDVDTDIHIVNAAIDDLTINDAQVDLWSSETTPCQTIEELATDSVTISAGAGATASLTVDATCGGLVTN